jgi:hypothetical protein
MDVNMSNKKWIPHPTDKWQVDWHSLKYHKHAMTFEESNAFMSTPNEDGSHKTRLDFHKHLHDQEKFGIGEPHDHFTPKDKR